MPIAIAMLILLAAIGGDEMRLAGRYERDAVLDGQLWRLVTAHFVHLGWSHTVLNLAGLGLVWALFASALRGMRGLWVLLASIAAIDAGFLLNEPQLEWYVGFSGVLHGLFAAGVIESIRAREPEAWLLAALFVIKLVWEQLIGPVPLTARMAGGNVIENAHLYGALGGTCAGLLTMRHRSARL
jgi:rhomboid family GlyGly-CTERM serine protease